jgi:predicted dehydrogenase
MSRSRNRILLVGCGQWGRYVLRDLVSLGCEVTAVARSEASRTRAAQYGARQIVGSIDAAGAADGAVIVTATSTHAPIVEQLLSRNIPIYVEKPLTASIPDAERLVALGGERIFVMDKWRYHPGVNMLAHIARSGELGPVVGVQSTRVGWGKGESDVDAAWHLAPHDLAIALEILGELPPPRCAVAEMVGEEVSGLIGMLGTRPWVTLHVSEKRRKHFREVRLACRDGVAVLADSYSDKIVITRYDGPQVDGLPQPEARPISSEMPLLRELRAFVEHVNGGPPPRSSAADALTIVRTIAALRSLAGVGETARA